MFLLLFTLWNRSSLPRVSVSTRQRSCARSIRELVLPVHTVRRVVVISRVSREEMGSRQVERLRVAREN